jgi:putative Holliday junction resolvase
VRQQPARPRTVLAFDFGTQKIGLAIGQELTKTASPLPAIKAKDGIPNWDQLAKIIAEWQPDLFVVGHPLNMDGTDNDVTVRARKFANRLNGRFHKPAELVDERLSSFDAKDLVKELHGKVDHRDTAIDSVAASLILETWFSLKPQ